ncbi:chemotaxis protein CheC [Clostridium oryzae]|uniref:CheY-P phosphatase CheC n=1 Tax=Clostridium oryzae TaxID=1450648 RepID=A0A1V4ILR3_9CLOT|nr:chemotaxis protein CheC [Clostridium oryzae]OPJ60866.1 CheY-P phosphatase CheC [Clostridium oryzae]
MESNEFSAMQLDALAEVGNIGAGNAATALSQLISKKVDMTVPSVNIIPFQEVFDRVSSEEVVIGVIIRVLGDTPGNILFTFDYKAAVNVVELLTDNKVESIDELGESALCEIGNIISATYMNAIGNFTQLSITPSVPAITQDMLGAILSTTFIESEQFDDYVLDIETIFLNEDYENIGGHFYYVPKPGSLEKILKALGVG